MEMVMGVDMRRVIIESDSLEVVQLLSTSQTSHSWEVQTSNDQYAEVIQQILRMRDDHGNIEFCHVYIEGNAIADYLAHVALECPFGIHYLEQPIGECRNLLLLDSPEDFSSSPTSL